MADRTACAPPAAEGQEADMSAITVVSVHPVLVAPALAVAVAPRVGD